MMRHEDVGMSECGGGSVGGGSVAGAVFVLLGIALWLAKDDFRH